MKSIDEETHRAEWSVRRQTPSSREDRMRFCNSIGWVAVALIVTGCGEGRKPANEPMPTDGPNQYVFSVPGMT
jgi:hypothetical protein